MSAQTIVNTELFQKCLDFHGHLCPGLSFGYQAAMAGMDWLPEQRAGLGRGSNRVQKTP